MESSWASVSKLLETLQESGAFPGAVALVGNASHTLYSRAFGNLTNDGRPPPLPFTTGVVLRVTFLAGLGAFAGLAAAAGLADAVVPPQNVQLLHLQ